MKKVLFTISICAIIISSILPSLACTGFAVYSDNVLYGMNFDYFDTEVKIVINKINESKVFSLVFKQGDSYFPAVKMNDKGLLITNQMQYPVANGKNKLNDGEMFLPQLSEHISQFNRLEDVKSFLNEVKLVHWNQFTIHNLIADADGNAAIIEVGHDNNEIMEMDNDFIVMSNFQNSSQKDVSYNKVSGVGADRYKKVYKYITNNKENFDITKAFEALKLTAQSSSTLSSMVFDPKQNCLYIAVHRNFDEVWKISIGEETIETFKGFTNSVKLNIPDEGIIITDLINSKYNNYELTHNSVVENDNTINDKSSNKLSIVVALGFILYLILYKKKR